jgi:hypothetical protein
MEVVSSSETSVNLYKTKRHDVPEDNRLHTSRRENLKSHRKQLLKRRVLLFIYLLFEISGFYGDEYEDDSILEYSSV